MIFDNEIQKEDFMEMLQKYPAPNAAAGYKLIQNYYPLIENAAVIPVDEQPQQEEKEKEKEDNDG